MQDIIRQLQLSASQIEILPSGFHTDVTLIIHNGRELVLKIISKSQFAQLEVAQTLAQDLRTYHELLATAGVLVPEIDRIEYMQSGRGHALVLVVPFVGYDAERKLASGELSITQVVRGVLECMSPLLRQHGDFLLRIGIDPKPANFVSHNGDKFHYVDWMPPRFWKSGRPLVEYEAPASAAGQELAFFRSYDVRGVMLVLQSQLSKLRPDERVAIKTCVRQFAREVGVEVEAYLRDLVSERVFSVSRNEALHLISGLTPKSIYEVREIACELVSRGIGDRQFLEEVFHLTHFFDDLPDPKLFRTAQQLVADHL